MPALRPSVQSKANNYFTVSHTWRLHLTAAAPQREDSFRSNAAGLLAVGKRKGRQLGLTHMPLSVSATYAPLHEYFNAAYALANAESPDPELDLEGQEAPNFGHHSDRRGADTVARQTREQTGDRPNWGWPPPSTPYLDSLLSLFGRTVLPFAVRRFA